MTTTDTRQAETSQPSAARARQPRFALYHPNGTGSGAALQMDLRLSRNGGVQQGCFFLDMAGQKTVASREGDRRSPATFDWEHKLTVRLDTPDICELLAVLEGKIERAGGARNGVYHENGGGSTVITCQRNAEKGGYFLGLSRKERDAPQARRFSVALGEAEAVGLRNILQAGLVLITFNGCWAAPSAAEPSAPASRTLPA